VSDDELLLAELRAVAARVDPVPAAVVDAARASLTWLRVDAELAELLSDSAVEHRSLALVRSDGGSRSLSFGSGELTIDVEILVEGSRRRLVGQLVPPGPGTVEVQSPTLRTTVDADDLGRFRADGVPPGRMRLRVTRDGVAVETSWIEI
jgi:hypothetical protein